MWRVGADVRVWEDVYEATRIMEQLTKYANARQRTGSGSILRVGISLDFVGVNARKHHRGGAYVRSAANKTGSGRPPSTFH